MCFCSCLTNLFLLRRFLHPQVLHLGLIQEDPALDLGLCVFSYLSYFQSFDSHLGFLGLVSSSGFFFNCLPPLFLFFPVVALCLILLSGQTFLCFFGTLTHKNQLKLKELFMCFAVTAASGFLPLNVIVFVPKNEGGSPPGYSVH